MAAAPLTDDTGSRDQRIWWAHMKRELETFRAVVKEVGPLPDQIGSLAQTLGEVRGDVRSLDGKVGRLSSDLREHCARAELTDRRITDLEVGQKALQRDHRGLSASVAQCQAREAADRDTDKEAMKGRFLVACAVIAAIASILGQFIGR